MKFTIERTIGSKLNTLAKLPWPPSFGQEVRIVDPDTVRIVTKVPDPMLPTALAAESMNMVPPKAMAEYREKFVSDRHIGTGPFRFVEYVVGDRVVLEAKPGLLGRQAGQPAHRVAGRARTRPRALAALRAATSTSC